jgi:hypothetical protein
MSNDPRFASLTSDPRFRRPKQKNVKAVIDPRFQDALDPNFGKVASKSAYVRG